LVILKPPLTPGMFSEQEGEGGLVTMILRRRREHNRWVHEAEVCVKEIVPEAHDDYGLVDKSVGMGADELNVFGLAVCASFLEQVPKMHLHSRL
jgi:hypothetical protein